MSVQQISGYARQFGNKETAKSIGWLALIVVFLAFGVKLYRWVTKLFNGTLGDEADNKEAASITKDITATVKVNYAQLPQPKTFYKLIADQQEKAMQGWGTDWSTLVNTLKKLNKAELEAVYQQFGGRVNKDFVNEAYDLFGWYKDEYSMFSPQCLVYWPSLVVIWNRTSLNNKPQL